MRKHGIYAAIALAMAGHATGAGAAPAYVDEDGNRFDPRCNYNRYNGPCLDVDLVKNPPAMYQECTKYENASAKEYAACVFGLDEARRMAERYAGGHGRMHGYLRGFAWGMNQTARAYENDNREIEAGRKLVDGMGEYMESGLKAGRDAGSSQGSSMGSSEARARFAKAMDTGRLPSDRIEQIPATSYEGERNGYERSVGNPKQPSDILRRDMADLNSQMRAYDGINDYVDRANYSIWDIWFGDGIYTFETRRWMDKDLALNVWIQKPSPDPYTKPKYENLNQGVPQVPVMDPVTGLPQKDANGNPVTRPAYDAKAIFRQSFLNAYNYYVSYNYSQKLYEGLDQGQAAGEQIGVLLGKRMAQQSGLITAFNEKYQSSSKAAFREAFEQAYMDSFGVTFADYRDNPKLEVLFDEVIGVDSDGILQPGEQIQAKMRIRNYGGRGTPLKIRLEGNVQETTEMADSVNPLSSKSILTPVLGKLDNRLANGASAVVNLRVNDVVASRSETVRRQVQLAGINSTVNATAGSGTVRIAVRNVSTARTAGRVVVRMEVNGQTDQRELGMLDPGQTSEAIIDFTGVDPMKIIRDGSIQAKVVVKVGELQVASDAAQIKPAHLRLEMVRYYNQLVNDRAYTPGGVDRQTRVADLTSMIVRMNHDETKNSYGNPWKDDALSTTIGLLVNEYANTQQSDSAKQAYRLIAAELYKSRKSFGKFLFFKSGKRKAYEGLCKRLPMK